MPLEQNIEKRLWRNGRIMQMRLAGQSVAEIGVKFGISSQMVSKLCDGLGIKSPNIQLHMICRRCSKAFCQPLNAPSHRRIHCGCGVIKPSMRTDTKWSRCHFVYLICSNLGCGREFPRKRHLETMLSRQYESRGLKRTHYFCSRNCYYDWQRLARSTTTAPETISKIKDRFDYWAMRKGGVRKRII